MIWARFLDFVSQNVGWVMLWCSNLMTQSYRIQVQLLKFGIRSKDKKAKQDWLIVALLSERGLKESGLPPVGEARQHAVQCDTCRCTDVKGNTQHIIRNISTSRPLETETEIIVNPETDPHSVAVRKRAFSSLCDFPSFRTAGSVGLQSWPTTDDSWLSIHCSSLWGSTTTDRKTIMNNCYDLLLRLIRIHNWHN